MDINQFLFSLLHSLSSIDFVETVDFHTEVFVLKGQATLRKNRFLRVYFNEITGTIAFALVENDKRIWGIDFDNIRGWHLHPVENSEYHHDISPKNLEEIISTLVEVWRSLR